MATVASASSGHGLSVLTNGCIKQPAKLQVKPKVIDYRESNSNSGRFVGVKNVNLHEISESEARAVNNWTVTMPATSNVVSSNMSTVDNELGALCDDQFYQRLLQLKKEHQKTLKLCEQLYRQKLASETDLEIDTEKESLIRNGHVSDSLSLENSQETNLSNTIPRDRLKDMTSKPPVAGGMHSLDTHRNLLNRPLSAPIRRPNLSHSLDDDNWRLMRREGLLYNGQDRSSYFNEETQSEIYDPREAAAAMAQIEDMWEDFSVEDYAPRHQRSARPSSVQNDKAQSVKKDKEWRHRITIPEPFQMTLRDSNTEKPKSKTQMLHEQEILQKQQEEEAECQKKFKAAPVPAHVYLPLFDEYNEKNEARRRYIKHYRKELLKSIEKPFKFMSREEKKRQQMMKSAPLTEQVPEQKEFKAKPVPDYLYDSSNEEKALEEMEYRKIRIKMRAEELMRSASLPPNMEARQKMKEQRLKDEKRRKVRTGRKKFAPRINSEVPDYDEMYRHFQKQMQRRKNAKEPTVMQPFKLRTGKIPSTQQKILNDIGKDEEILLEKRWPYKNPRTTPRKSFVSNGVNSSSLDTIPHRTSSSADLRARKARNRARSLTQREMDEIEYHKRQRQKEIRLRQAILEKTKASEKDRQARPSHEEKLKEYRESERARMAEYRKSLEDIKHKVDQRPLLFEQVKQASAKKAAEKRYSETLREYGLDETYVQQKSSVSGGIDTDHTDQEDISYDSRRMSYQEDEQS